MTSTMHDDRPIHGCPGGEADPTTLCRGTLLYLWAPGVARGSGDRTLARVDAATAHMIDGVDLRDGVPRRYNVGRNAPPGLRWTWEVAAPPRPSFVGTDGIERIETCALTIEQRVRLVCGAAGAKITVRLKSGDVIPQVRLDKLIMGPDPMAWSPEWAVFVGDPDSRGPVVHVLRCTEIAGISRDPDL